MNNIESIYLINNIIKYINHISNAKIKYSLINIKNKMIATLNYNLKFDQAVFESELLMKKMEENLSQMLNYYPINASIQVSYITSLKSLKNVSTKNELAKLTFNNFKN